MRQQGGEPRHQFALERLRSAADREAAAEDRRHAARERRLTGEDELTGALLRAAGARLLRDLAAAISAALRPYDLIVRRGGDEFLLTMPESTTPEARRRVAAIQHALTERAATATISAGHAQLQPSDTLESLLARAHVALDAAKRSSER